MSLNDSFPLLKKLSGFAATQYESSSSPSRKTMIIRARNTNGTNDPHVPTNIDASPGLPKSPRISLTPETASALRRPILAGEENGSRSRQRSLTPSSRRPKLYSSPMDADSRDDSNYGGSVGQSTISTSVVPFTPASPLSNNGDDMDDVLIHRYLAEKNKHRASEAKNIALHSHIEELNRHIDDQAATSDKDRAVALAKISEQENMVKSLKNTIDDLREQQTKKGLESEMQKKELYAENEEKIKRIREETNRELDALKVELSKSEKMLEEKITALSQMNINIQEMQETHENRTKVLVDQVQEAKALKLKIALMEEHGKKSDEEGLMLRNALENLNEMLEFQSSKGNELSNELKTMSYQYVQSLEKLDEESANSRKLRTDLDNVESRLKGQMKENTIITNQLEEMARGYIETDELLEKEKLEMKDLQQQLSLLINELEEERSKSKELAVGLESTTLSYKQSTEENLKLSGVASSLSFELTSVKKTLAKSLGKVKSLSKKLKDSHAFGSKTENALKKETDRAILLETKLGEVNESNASLLADLTAVEAKLSEEVKTRSDLSVQLDAMSAAHDAIHAALQKERAEYEMNSKEQTNEILSLSSERQKLEEDCSAQKVLITSLESDLSTKMDQCERLNSLLAEKTEECAVLEKKFEAQNEESSEHRSEQDESITTLTKELESLEKKYTQLFDNLVETESKLQESRESLEKTELSLQRKEADFEPIEKMLREEISSKDEAVKRGQEQSRDLSSQLVELNKKNSAIHSSFAESKARLILAEEKSLSLQDSLIESERKCKNLTLSLEREKNGPAQRKLKVAKRMIRAEKDRYLAILKEVEAKNLIISRIENQSETYKNQLTTLTKELDEEKRKKTTHSGRALQDLHRQLEDERKTVKNEKEILRAKLKAEKSKVKSLSTRLSVAEGSSEMAAEVSAALKEKHDASEEIRLLTETNEQLLNTVSEKNKTESALKKQMYSMEKKLREVVESMDTMAQYCTGLEEERRVLKLALEKAKSNEKSADDDDNDGYSYVGDEDTLDGKSLSDFSVALIPPPRQTQSEILKKRTAVSAGKEDGGNIELTVDTKHLYD
jgi:hypothetical protein